jgi:hypothetical protein
MSNSVSPVKKRESLSLETKLNNLLKNQNLKTSIKNKFHPKPILNVSDIILE